MTAPPAPKDVLDFWIGEAGNSAEAATSKNKMWFAKSAKIDSDIRKKFLSLLETLAAGPLADDWSGRGARERLAAIIVLDQFSRNLFRDSPRAFSQDALALRLCKEGLSRREDLTLSEASSIFPSNIRKISATRPAPSKCFRRSIKMLAAISGN